MLYYNKCSLILNLNSHADRLGGMHSLMSFIGSIGALMADTGLSDIMSSVFGGVSKMEKSFPRTSEHYEW